MTGLLNGADVPWDFISGDQEHPNLVDPIAAARAARRLDEGVRQLEHPTPAVPPRRLIVAGMGIARNLATQMRRL